MAENRWGVEKRPRKGKDEAFDQIEWSTRASLASEGLADETASFILGEAPEGAGPMGAISDWLATASATRAKVSEGVDIESYATPSEAEQSWSSASVANVVAKRIAQSAGQTPKVSVIVPVYNAERYLAECLDSLVMQTLGALEVVCVDDGSTDSSLAILESYAERDSRFTVMTKHNTGYGDTMNIGLSVARGDYIGICEADDFADPKMYEMLYRTAKHYDADIAKADYCQHREGSGFDAPRKVLAGFAANKPFDPIDKPEILLVEPSIWSGIYRRQMIADNNIAFNSTPGASYQDASFGQQCWICAKCAVLLMGAYLHYRIDNEDSSSVSSDKVYAICDEYEHTFAFLAARGRDYLEFYGPWLNVMRQGQYLWNYNRIAAEHHAAFADRWLADVQAAEGEGLLGEDLMTAGYRKLLAELREGAQAFAKRYPGEIEYPPIR